MKAQANSKRRDAEFEHGDMVFLHLQPYRQQPMAKRHFEKLSPQLFGPYPVLSKVGKAAYGLQLPLGANVYPVFHVSLLKLAQGYDSQAPLPPLPISKDWEFQVEPAKVLHLTPGIVDSAEKQTS